jgi:hypothetical protein
MKVAPKPPAAIAQIGAAMGVPSGKKMSIRNLLRARGKKRATRANDANDPGDHEYR